MLALSVVAAGLQAAQAWLAPAHDGYLSRAVVAGLCYLQPLVRSWRRYQTRLFCPADHRTGPEPDAARTPLPLTGRLTRRYWTETWQDRTELLRAAAAALADRRWGVAYDSGWEAWDLELHGHPWSRIEVRSVQEEHGGGKRLIRIGVRLRPSATAALLGVGGSLALLGLTAERTLLTAEPVPPLLAAAVAAPLLVAAALIWARGRRLAAAAVAAFDAAARELGLIACPDGPGRAG
jgi:hypothetical protein